MSFQDTEYRIIPFISMKGGTGRSTAAANAAYLLARVGNKVLLIDGDVEAPGLSLLNAFQPIEGYSYGRGIINLTNDCMEGYEKKLKDKLKEHPNIAKSELTPIRINMPDISDYIHPVLIGPGAQGTNQKLVCNKWFHEKKSSSSFGAQRSLTDFSPNGQLWLMPTYRNAVNQALNWDDLRPVVANMFAGHRRRPDFNHSGQKQTKGSTFCVETETAVKTLQTVVHHIVDGGQKQEKPFDYVLIDTRSGLDPWTLYVLLPMAGQLAVAAQLNEQGSCETRKFIQQIRSEAFIQETGIPKNLPIKWFSQILPAGENQLRQDRLYQFTRGFQPPGTNTTPIPYFPPLSESDIIPIFYNSSLPLREDILAVDVDPDFYQGEPYWRLTDNLCSAYQASLIHLESRLFQILDKQGREYFSDHAVEKLENNDLQAILLDELLPDLELLSFYEPRTCLSYLTRLGERSLFRQRILDFCEAANGPQPDAPDKGMQAAQRYLAIFIRLANKTTGTLFLSQLLEGIKAYAQSGRSEGIRLADEAAVIRLEENAHSIHVATRRFLYDQHTNFQDAVRDNLLHGKTYHYYATDAYGQGQDDSSQQAWEQVCGIMDAWCRDMGPGLAQPGNYKEVPAPEEQDKKIRLPKKVHREHALPPDLADLVIYSDRQGGGSAVIFPQDPDNQNAYYYIVQNPLLVQALAHMLANSRLLINPESAHAFRDPLFRTV